MLGKRIKEGMEKDASSDVKGCHKYGDVRFRNAGWKNIWRDRNPFPKSRVWTSAYKRSERTASHLQGYETDEIEITDVYVSE
jgi:hypothetical protein